jgi:hypothetical protein
VKKLPHYVRQLKYLHAIGAIPRVGVAQVDVLHDGWCNQLAQQGPCNCRPEVKVRSSVDATRRN